MINPFSTIEPIHLLYFSYGSAFLFLAFSIGTKNLKGSNLRIAGSLWLLAMFGLAHGVRGIVEIYPLVEGGHLALDELFYIEIIDTALLISSYLFLLQFGLSLSVQNKRIRAIWTAVSYAALCIILVLFVELHDTKSRMLTVMQVEFGARNTFGLLGGLLAAYGMIAYSYSSEIKNLNSAISRNIYYAGIALACHALLTATFISALSGLLNVPSELFRAGAAVLIAYFIVKALNIFDVETRLQVEKQARYLAESEKMVLLGQLAAGIAHEINNPLTNASLGIQMLRSRLGNDSDPALKERINSVEKNIDRASVIARELLQFSRQREVEFHLLNINAVISDALAQMKHKLGTIVIERGQAPVPTIRGDKGKLEQVFINIFSNAADSMPEGGRITISTLLKEGMVEAMVADTGSGISSENMVRVFDTLFTTKEAGSGTGLGLSLCKEIIRQHLGSIDISSIEGQGTTVTIKIPIGE